MRYLGPVVLCAVSLSVMTAFGQTDPTADSGPPILLKILYHNYPGNTPFPATNLIELSRYFDETLIALFIKDADCSRKTGEVCGLDSDPIYDTQENVDPKRTITIQKQPMSFAHYFVTITEAGKPRLLTYDFSKSPRGWRISDITYPDGSSLKKSLSSGQPS